MILNRSDLSLSPPPVENCSEGSYFSSTIKLIGELIARNPDRFRMNSTDFTRARKLSIKDIVYFSIAQHHRTAYSEVMSYAENMIDDNCHGVTPSAMYKARTKLNPDGIKWLQGTVTSNFYTEHHQELKDFHGRLLVAIDGSDIVVPYSKENTMEFGQAKNGTANQKNNPCMAKMQCVYDVLNDLYLDVQIERCKFDERSLAERNIEEVTKLFPYKTLFMFDRGYFSYRLMYLLLQKNHDFIFRMSASFLKEYQEQVAPGESKIFEIQPSRISTNDYREEKVLRNHLLNTIFRVRICKPEHIDENGNKTHITLLSSITDETVTIDEMSDLYHKRWKIETSYNYLKNYHLIEQFGSRKKNLIFQELYAEVLAYNLVTIAEMDTLNQQPIEQENYRQEMKLNRNNAVGSVKEYLIQMMAAEDEETRRKYEKKLMDRIRSKIVPIRPGRAFERRNTPKNKQRGGYKPSY